MWILRNFSELSKTSRKLLLKLIWILFFVKIIYSFTKYIEADPSNQRVETFILKRLSERFSEWFHWFSDCYFWIWTAGVKLRFLATVAYRAYQGPNWTCSMALGGPGDWLAVNWKVCEQPTFVFSMDVVFQFTRFKSTGPENH